MRGVNKVILLGNLGKDPEMRYSPAGVAVARFRIATSEKWRDRQSNEQKERTEWHSIVCFQRLAEIAGEYLRKGSKVYIEGRLQTDSWEQEDGQKRYRTEIYARELQMLDSRSAPGGYDDRPAASPAASNASANTAVDAPAEATVDAPAEATADAPAEATATADATATAATGPDPDDDIPF